MRSIGPASETLGLLLDTHARPWWVTDDSRLSETAHTAFTSSPVVVAERPAELGPCSTSRSGRRCLAPPSRLAAICVQGATRDAVIAARPRKVHVRP